MNENITTREITDLIAEKAGITKKRAAGLLHAIPEVIEEGLRNDGEVRVKGLGTFRLKWTQPRVGRNPKTGETVRIPRHKRLVFLPEQSLKDFINRDYSHLSIKVIPEGEAKAPVPAPVPERPSPEPVGQRVPEPVAEAIKETTPPVKKKRIHWIIPVAALVIILLAVVFYYRNFQSVPGSGFRVPEPKTSESELPVLQAEPEGSAVDSQQSAVGGQEPVADSIVTTQSIEPTQSTQNSTLTQNSEPTQHSTLNTQHSEAIPEGSRLFKLARDYYNDQFLWVLIYKANQDKISDPDMVISGHELIIPQLEGKPGHLSHNDSLAVSEGYKVVYEYYNSKNDPKADEYRKGISRYKP